MDSHQMIAKTSASTSRNKSPKKITQEEIPVDPSTRKKDSVNTNQIKNCKLKDQCP